jgi:hypothetical protein
VEEKNAQIKLIDFFHPVEEEGREKCSGMGWRVGETWIDGACAAGNHFLCIVSHVWVGRDMEIPEHFASDFQRQSSWME